MSHINSEFLLRYRNDAVKSLLHMNPNWDEDEVASIVEKEMKKSFQNPEVVMDNNFTKQTQKSSLLSVLDWVERKEPIIAGNGTFYKNQHQAINPVANMLDGWLKKRKAIKKEMFAIVDKTSQEYKDKDLGQMIQKVNANSYYGASGMPQSAFYSKYSGPATTSTAQSVISTCCSTFEAFIMDNYYFLDDNECFHWLNCVVDQIEEDPETDWWVKSHTAEEVFFKLKEMFYQWNDKYEAPLWAYVSNLEEYQLTRIYYRNRLEEFTKDHPEIQKIHKRIMDNVNTSYPILSGKEAASANWKDYVPHKLADQFQNGIEYNAYASKEAFMDPNDVPESVSDDVKLLAKYYMKYVYTKYLVFDRIYRLKNFKRKTAMVIDTDSNILALDHWVLYMLDTIGKDSDKEKENQEFIIINTITYTLTSVITDILLYYGENSNIPEEFRGRFNMKNEYFMKRLIVSEVKKRYMSLFKLREGKLLNPPKTDIKGFDFKKSATSDICEEIFTRLSEEYLLKSDKIDVKALKKELENMMTMIEADIKAGNTTYLPIASAKELEAYANPGGEQSIRGVLAWNALYPESAIDLPNKVKMLKLTLFEKEDILPIQKTNPEIYEILKREIFEDKSGIFVTVKKTAKGVTEKCKGLQVLAIPNTAKIPDWVKPYIDYTNMIGSIMGPFKSVTELLKINTVTTGFSKNGVNRKTDLFTNTIRF